MLNSPRQKTLLGLSSHGFHRLAYYEWGDPLSSEVVICVHGLTRNGRDFDLLAQALLPRFRVLCPDMPGRGQSEWLKNAADYAFPTYLNALTALIARSGIERVRWVGTSMGGLLGLIIAAQASSPVAKLVINDVGPVLEPAALARIGEYVARTPTFETYEAFSIDLKTISAPFGPLTDQQWAGLIASSARKLADGRWTYNYDPAIATAFRAAGDTRVDLWPLWDRILCPTLLMRGEKSDLLSPATAAAMIKRGPRPRLIEVDGVGHAPMFQSSVEIEPVVAFLSTD